MKSIDSSPALVMYSLLMVLFLASCSNDERNYSVVTEGRLRFAVEEGLFEPGEAYAVRGQFYDANSGEGYAVGDSQGALLTFNVSRSSFDVCIEEARAYGWIVVYGVYGPENTIQIVDAIESAEHTLDRACE